jgi:hypothetical protein
LPLAPPGGLTSCVSLGLDATALIRASKCDSDRNHMLAT